MLTGMEHFLQRYRVRESLQRIDPISCLLHRHQPISRRKYSMPGPNSSWHIDGHHSLIRWGLVIHCGLDGFSGLIVYLYCSTNNKADTAGALPTVNYIFWSTLTSAIRLWRERGCLRLHDLVLWGWQGQPYCQFVCAQPTYRARVAGCFSLCLLHILLAVLLSRRPRVHRSWEWLWSLCFLSNLH